MAAAVMAGLGSFLLTVPTFSANTLAEVQQYAAARECVHRRPDPATVVHGRSRDAVLARGHLRDHLAHLPAVEFQRG